MQINNVYLDWLHRRHITDETIKEFDIHIGDYGHMKDCIVIPIRDTKGNSSFNKYRRNPLSEEGPKYLYDQGGKVQLYGIHKAKYCPTILITEGEMDTLVAWSAQIPAVSSTGGALSFQEDWLPFFIDKEVIICFDNDEAGGAGMAKTFDMIPHAKILFLPDRPGIKDISDYVQNGGDLNFLIKSAVIFTSMESIIEHRSSRVALWQSTYFHDSYIKNHTPKPIKSYSTDRVYDTDRIKNAKKYPISNLLTFDQTSKCPCIWHSEKTASLHYFPAGNNLYCFGCGKFADSIDVYRQLHNCSFLEAVKNLQ